MIDTPGYLGRFQQGTEIPLILQCTGANDEPDVPSVHPQVAIFRDSATPTKLETRMLGACDQGFVSGMFRISLFLGALYGTAGRYLCVFKWSDSDGVSHTRCSYFTLNPGGDQIGSTIAINPVDRPNASYLLRLTDAGAIIRSKNPR